MQYLGYLFMAAATLYGALFLVACVRLVLRLRNPPDGVPRGLRGMIHRKSRGAALVLFSLCLYSPARSVSCSIDAFENVILLSTVDVSQNVASTVFIFLQLALNWKWLHHVDTIEEYYAQPPFAAGHIAVRALIILLLVYLLLVTTAFVDVFALNDAVVSMYAWAYAVDATCGTLYLANGILFLMLGFKLRSTLYDTATSGSVRKMFAMTLILGSMLVFRGLMLIVITIAATFDRSVVTNVGTLGWALPLALLIEWCGIVLALIVLPEHSDGGRNSSVQLQNASLAPLTGVEKQQEDSGIDGTPLQKQRPRSPRSPRLYDFSYIGNTNKDHSLNSKATKLFSSEPVSSSVPPTSFVDLLPVASPNI